MSAHPTTTIGYIAAIKKAHGITSDYAVAKLLGVNRQSVSMYKSGKRQFDTRTCFRVAELLKDQPAAVIAHIEAERAEKAGREDEAADWRGVLKKIGGAAASILLAAGIGGFSNADATLARPAMDSTGYTSSKTKRRKKATPWSGLLSFSPAFAL
jgi:transcriptional regulator with XRE-family HTH domain